MAGRMEDLLMGGNSSGSDDSNAETNNKGSGVATQVAVPPIITAAAPCSSSELTNWLKNVYTTPPIPAPPPLHPRRFPPPPMVGSRGVTSKARWGRRRARGRRALLLPEGGAAFPCRFRLEILQRWRHRCHCLVNHRSIIRAIIPITSPSWCTPAIVICRGQYNSHSSNNNNNSSSNNSNSSSILEQ